MVPRLNSKLALGGAACSCQFPTLSVPALTAIEQVFLTPPTTPNARGDRRKTATAEHSGGIVLCRFLALPFIVGLRSERDPRIFDLRGD